jgi:hypothetical protein
MDIHARFSVANLKMAAFQLESRPELTVNPARRLKSTFAQKATARRPAPAHRR